MNISYNPTTNAEPATSGVVGANKGNITMVVFLFVIIIVFYLLFASLGIGGLGSDGSSNGSEGSSGFSGFFSSGNGTPGATANPRLTRLFEILVWSIFVVLIFVNGMQYLFNVNVSTEVKNLFSDKPEIDIEVSQPYTNTAFPVLKAQKQVFNIPGNYYTYDDAKAICDAYGARLASYNEMEEAYNKGAEWCVYGWSDNQMALFPTQKRNMAETAKNKGA